MADILTLHQISLTMQGKTLLKKHQSKRTQRIIYHISRAFWSWQEYDFKNLCASFIAQQR
nr:hypothetical protein [Limosilactobacillus mucosae]